MLPSFHRLRLPKDVQAVYRLGQFFGAGPINVWMKKNGLKSSRIGFAVGLKFSSKAVERNRIKRQLRSLARRHIAHVQPGYDIMVSVKKKEKVEFSLKDLERFFLEALKKGRLIS